MQVNGRTEYFSPSHPSFLIPSESIPRSRRYLQHINEMECLGSSFFNGDVVCVFQHRQVTANEDKWQQI